MDATWILLAACLLALPAVLLVLALVQVAELRGRVVALERRLARPAAEADGTAPGRDAFAPSPARAAPAPVAANPPAPVTHGASRAAPTRREPPPPATPSPGARVSRAVRRWFSEGNVPVKVGMLVLFAGVAALFDYASDQGWLRLPLQLRLAGVAAVALGAIAFAWRQRRRRRQFSLAVQGGAIGVLLLVVFAACRLYGFLSPGVAFALSAALVAAACALAVLQEAPWLALLAVVAGFLAPLWLSDGAGDPVVLFGYYALLNAGIFAMAWWRPWPVLAAVGFAFTFGIGAAWGVLDYRPEDYPVAQGFLLLFFALYVAAPVLQRRRRPVRRDRLDGCLLFGTPLAAFSLQAGLLDGQAGRLAWCAIGLAALYALLAWACRGRERFRELVAPYGALAVGFATLAVPLALSARATSGVFALEGAALCWLGLRQRSRRQQFAGAALQVAAAFAYLWSLEPPGVGVPLVANAAIMGAMLLAAAGFASAWSHRTGGSARAAAGYYGWGLAWWFGAGWHEIDRADVHAADFRMVLVVATGWIASEVHRRLPSRALAWTATLALATAVPFAFAQDAVHDHPLAAHGWIAWALFAVAGWRMLGSLRADPLASVAHAAWWVAWALAAALCLHALAVHLDLGGGWRIAGAATPWLLLAAGLQWRPAWVAPPFGSRFDAWRCGLQRVVLAVLALGWLAALRRPGDATPLPWLPIANPLDSVQLATLALAAAWQPAGGAGRAWARHRMRFLAAGVFALASVIVLRACHHWGGVPWSIGMFESGLVQAALSVAWSVLGVGGWVLGSRRGERALWLAGAVLMGVVLAKLLLVDRQHLGNLTGILSFIVYGVMCTVVGYLAPAPPREAALPPAPAGRPQPV